MAIDDTGNVYIADTDNNRIRKIDHVIGFVSSYAGTGVAADIDALSSNKLVRLT